jgi:hypothetical protein
MTSTQSQDDFEKALKAIQEELLDGENEDESYAEIADAFRDQVLKRERARRGVNSNPEMWPEIDAETIEKMKNWDTNDPELVLTEKALRRIAGNQKATGVKLIDDYVVAKEKSLSIKQSKVAQNARKKNPITVYIEELVAIDPTITENGLDIKLRNAVGGGVIESYLAEEFTPVDDSFPSVKRSALKNKLYRAKKKAKINSR